MRSAGVKWWGPLQRERTGLNELHVDGIAELDILEGCEVFVSPVGHISAMATAQCNVVECLGVGAAVKREDGMIPSGLIRWWSVH